MKASLLFGTLTLWAATLPSTGMSELDQLRKRCAAQEQQIQKLQAELEKHQKPTAKTASSDHLKRSPDQGFSSYTVKKGDSLGRIANRFKSTPESIAQINHLKLNSVIHPGQKLRVPAADVSSKPASHRTTPESYRIREGDTYSSISRHFGIPVASLIAANPSVKATAMRPGQTIRLVGAPASAPIAKSSAPKPTSPPAPVESAAHAAAASTPMSQEPGSATAASMPQETVANHSSSASADPAPSPSTAERKIHPVMINGEMTYGEFASQHGTDIDRLNDLNGLDLTSATVLARGSELYVPAQP